MAARAGAVETLRTLKARGLKIALVSNFDGRLHRVVAELGLKPFFDAVIVSSEAGWAKPSPRIYAAALGALGVEPGEALMVGDRPKEDAAGATAAGLKALLYDPHGRAPGRVRSAICVRCRGASQLYATFWENPNEQAVQKGPGARRTTPQMGLFQQPAM